MLLGKSSRRIFYYYEICREKLLECIFHASLSALVMYFHWLFFYSEDLEDTHLCVGLTWCRCVHGQRLHEDARPSTSSGRICAVSSPAHPHQGQSATLSYLAGFTIKIYYVKNINVSLLCLLPEISLGRWKPLYVPQPSYKRSAWRLWELPSLRGSVIFPVSSVLGLIILTEGAKLRRCRAVHLNRNKTTLCCITMSGISFV